jgi:hypothetical protein
VANVKRLCALLLSLFVLCNVACADGGALGEAAWDRLHLAASGEGLELDATVEHDGSIHVRGNRPLVKGDPRSSPRLNAKLSYEELSELNVGLEAASLASTPEKFGDGRGVVVTLSVTVNGKTETRSGSRDFAEYEGIRPIVYAISRAVEMAAARTARSSSTETGGGEFGRLAASMKDMTRVALERARQVNTRGLGGALEKTQR